MPASACPPPCIPSPEEAGALRAVLAAGGFSDRELIGKLGGIALPTRRNHTLPRMMRLTRDGTPLDTLARLFLFGVPVPAGAARAALDPVPLETLCRLGLVEMRGEEAAATCVVYPYGDLLIAFDKPEQFASGAPADVVVGISGSTINLARFTVRQHVRNVLDLGTGCGFQAFLAAAHAERVYAVDYCARAVGFARFNAALNGLDNVECLYGDRFEPVRGRRFDLIVGNLPFVIGPAGRYLYRDGGMELDSFSRGVIRDAAGHLEDGGLCQVMCDWAHIEGQDWRERLASWFEGTGCDAWVLMLRTSEALQYAEMWALETDQEDHTAFTRTFDEWAEYLQRNRVESVSTGLVAMRRAPGRRNTFRIDEWRADLSGGFGVRVERALAISDFLRECEGERLLGVRLVASPEARVVTEREWTPGAWRELETRIHLPFWPEHGGSITPNLLYLLALLDGKRTVREGVAAVAVRLNRSFDEVAAACVPALRQLIAAQLVLPRELAD